MGALLGRRVNFGHFELRRRCLRAAAGCSTNKGEKEESGGPEQECDRPMLISCSDSVLGVDDEVAAFLGDIAEEAAIAAMPVSDKPITLGGFNLTGATVVKSAAVISGASSDRSCD